MDLISKLSILDQLYSIYDAFSSELVIACKKKCSICCTRNVTMTTLEGYKLAENLISEDKAGYFKKVETVSLKKRYKPEITVNKLAELCAKGEEPPEEDIDHSWGECPLLTDGECPVYPVRPFGCRCFISSRDCGETGHAEVEPFIITVNNIFSQYLEHIDADGYSGNFTDVLLYMNSDENRRSYAENKMIKPFDDLNQNRTIRVLMIPPEDRSRVQPILEAIQHIKVPLK